MAMPTLRDILNGTPGDATDVEFNFNTIETYFADQDARLDILESRVGCSLTRAASQSFSSGGNTSISWDTEVSDSDGLWSSGSAVTIPTGKGGLYAATLRVVWSAELSDADSFIWIRRNSDGLYWSQNCSPSTSSVGGPSGHSIVVPIVAGDIFTAGVSNGSASTQNITARFDVYRVGL